ncbi:immunoglobulin domain-containing protein [Gabonibacter massiliensis]|uniref:immunoglobulin domain-containing protein n=1 Tax=Gabonibacter massiliensis TaxID=1720195 RepID=UPI00073EE60E|nr:immunoglobulin domain-containing protein [Gabonibacter massiliensis]
MKKVMMLFMVSVFFFAGDVCDGVAQSNEDGIPQIISNTGGEIIARPGSTVQWSYFLLNLENWDIAMLYFQRSGQAPKFIIALGNNGFIYRPTPGDYRFVISCNYSKTNIYITLSDIQTSDEGVYYLVVKKGTTDYFSYGDRLIVKYD